MPRLGHSCCQAYPVTCVPLDDCRPSGVTKRCNHAMYNISSSSLGLQACSLAAAWGLICQKVNTQVHVTDTNCDNPWNRYPSASSFNIYQSSSGTHPSHTVRSLCPSYHRHRRWQWVRWAWCNTCCIGCGSRLPGELSF
jgi:hypothetical protein